MSTKYHFNPETGLVNICHADDNKCPLKNEDGSQVSHGSDKNLVQEQGLTKLKNDYNTGILTKENTTVKLDVHSEQIDILMQNASIYKKSQTVKARKAQKNEKLETILKNKTVETSRILKGDEMVITNPSGEEYAVEKKRFFEKILPR